MKRALIACTLILALGLFAGIAVGQQQGAQQSPQGQGWFCPWCGQGSGQMGSGMMRGQGQMGPGMMRGQGQMGSGMRGYGSCPRMMQQGRGHGMGPGMMHHGYGQGRGQQMGPGMMHHGWGRGQTPSAQGEQMQAVTKNKARMLLEEYVAANPNLQVGEIQEQDDGYLGRIETKDGSLVEKIRVDKESGWMKKEY